MADNEKIYAWSSTPTLKKIRIGNTDYWLKDAEARDVIDNLGTQVASIQADLSAEISARASADEALGGRIDAVVSDLAAEVSARASAVLAEAGSRSTMDAALSARIDNLESRGRYLSTWDTTTGKPQSYPTIESYPFTYTFRTGDYYIVGKVGSTNLRPKGGSISKESAEAEWVIESEAETATVAVGDTYTYDGSKWNLIHTEFTDTNQTVKALGADGSTMVTFDSNASVQFVGEGAVSIVGSNVSGAEKITISSTDHITAIASTVGSGNVLTGLEADASGNLTITKGVTVEDGAEVNIIETVKVGGSALEVVDKAVNIETQAAGSLALKNVASYADLASDLQTLISGKSVVTASETGTATTNAKYITINGSEWKLGDVDKSYVDTELSKKVDKVDGSRLMTNAEGSKLADIASGAQVNVIEKIRLNGSDLTPDAEKRIDLGEIAVTSAVVANVSYVEASHVLQQTKGSVTTDVHVFGALADKSSASGSVAAATISGVQATGTAAGSISVQLDQTDTAIGCSGSFKPEGSISVELKDNVIQSKKTDGVVPTFSEGAYTPASIGSGFYTAGTAATWTGASYTAPSLGSATTDQFVKEGIVAVVGSGVDAECLIFSDASKSAAVTAQGTFDAGSHSFGTFNGGTPTVVDVTKFNGGAKASDTFTAGSMPVFEEITVAVSSQTFTGTQKSISVEGSYKQASVNTSGTKFTGGAITLDVGDITVPAHSVTVQ